MIFFLLKLKSNAKIFDLSNTGNLDHLEFSLSLDTTGQPYVAYTPVSDYCLITSSRVISLGVWHHLATVLSGQNQSLYMDGLLVASTICATTYIPPYVNRSNCMIGRSSFYPDEADAYADFDELKIYSRALSYDEILADMN